MNANLAVIVDNLDYLLWGRLADGIPGGVVLTLLMAIGAAALALPGGDLRQLADSALYAARQYRLRRAADHRQP